MELVEVVATAHFTNTRIGAVSRKQRLRLPVMLAEELESLSLVKTLNPHSTTAADPRQTAPQVVGGGESSASSPADQASQSKIASESASQDGQQSPSTIATAERHSQTSCTPATDNGGTSIAQQSGHQDSQENFGRKTKPQRGVTTSKG